MSNNKQSSVDKEFVSYEQALALKELGFNEGCLDQYSTNGESWRLKVGFIIKNQNLSEGSCSAPLYQQAFRWFREKYKMAIINPDWNNKFKYKVFNLHLLTQGLLIEESGFETYEEAELACLRKLIEIANEQQ